MSTELISVEGSAIPLKDESHVYEVRSNFCHKVITCERLVLIIIIFWLSSVTIYSPTQIEKLKTCACFNSKIIDGNSINSIDGSIIKNNTIKGCKMENKSIDSAKIKSIDGMIILSDSIDGNVIKNNSINIEKINNLVISDPLISSGLTFKPTTFDQVIIYKIPITTVTPGSVTFYGHPWGQNSFSEISFLAETSNKSNAMVFNCYKMRYGTILGCERTHFVGNQEINISVTISGFLGLNWVNLESENVKTLGY